MSQLRVQINPQREGRYLGPGQIVAAESVEAAIQPLDALPGDALWAEFDGISGRAVYVVENTDRGVVAKPS
ncbi:MAG TPA: hypothetical protein VND98_06175 [Solirubrobacterales bacterium]|nr:hypothetical protein [Solirubrobacterales bacterium]